MKRIFYILLFCIILIIGCEPRKEQIVELASGKIISIRATGSFNIYDIELKFDDGSLLLITYDQNRRWNLKVNNSVRIYDSSFYGYKCEKIN